MFQPENRLHWWEDQVPGNLVHSYLCTFTLECISRVQFLQCLVKKVEKDSLRYKITLLWLAYFIYIGSHRFGPEIARQIRKSDVEMEKEQGDIEALDSIRFFFYLCHVTYFVTVCSKSTLIRLLFRLFEPQQGRILIGGQDISTVNVDSLRQAIAIVPQVFIIFFFFAFVLFSFFTTFSICRNLYYSTTLYITT